MHQGKLVFAQVMAHLSVPAAAKAPPVLAQRAITRDELPDLG